MIYNSHKTEYIDLKTTGESPKYTQKITRNKKKLKQSLTTLNNDLAENTNSKTTIPKKKTNKYEELNAFTKSYMTEKFKSSSVTSTKNSLGLLNSASKVFSFFKNQLFLIMAQALVFCFI